MTITCPLVTVNSIAMDTVANFRATDRRKYFENISDEYKYTKFASKLCARQNTTASGDFRPRSSEAIYSTLILKARVNTMKPKRTAYVATG